MKTEPSSSSTIDEGLLRITEASRFLGVSRSKLYSLMETGEVAYVKFGKSRRIAWSELRRLVERHTVQR